MRSSRQRAHGSRGTDAAGHLERGRKHFEQRAWASARSELAHADRESSLAGDDLERLATATYFAGRDVEYLEILERAHSAHSNAGARARAVRCAFWLGFRLLMRGETGRANGWLARGQRLLQQYARDCAEQGYLLLPVVERHLASGDLEAAYRLASEAAAIGERCGDADLVVCARHQQGRIRLQEGQVQAGLALLDETMLAVTADELSPMVTGLMYCSVISACQQVYAFDRSREWTVALTRWCEAQPELVPFTGVCQVHRAEIMQLQGAWTEALDEARRAYARSAGIDRRAAAGALYQQGEIHRLRGEFAAAEDAYRHASQHGFEPQPGLALLRLAQGRTGAAAAAIRRIADTAVELPRRMNLLPACIEIMLAAGEIDDARKACRELEKIVRRFDTAIPDAIAAQARGAVALAEGNAQAALRPLRHAFEAWQRIEAPYASARVRVLLALACRAVGDEDGVLLELDAARAAFERLGAASDLDRIRPLTGQSVAQDTSGLTARELEVLRLVAAGETNKAIAGKLALSEKTVDRHVSNILTKLDVASRTAAAALAYRRKLV